MNSFQKFIVPTIEAAPTSYPTNTESINSSGLRCRRSILDTVCRTYKIVSRQATAIISQKDPLRCVNFIPGRHMQIMTQFNLFGDSAKRVTWLTTPRLFAAPALENSCLRSATKRRIIEF